MVNYIPAISGQFPTGVHDQLYPGVNSGKCTDKSKAPDADLNQEHNEAKVNDYIQIGSVAISIDGGRACAEQSLSQSNSNVQIASLQAKNTNQCENEGKSEGKSAESPEIHKTKAEAIPKGREKAIIVIDLGRYKIELIVDSCGDVLLNKKKIKSGKKC